MPSTAQFRDHVLGRLLAFGPVQARAMFGGYGLYLDGIMFALIANDVLYFKVDDGNRQEYVDAGCTPFTYAGKRRPVEMSYYTIPESVIEDPEALAEWAGRAHEAARRSRIAPPPRRGGRAARRRPRRRG